MRVFIPSHCDIKAIVKKEVERQMRVLRLELKHARQEAMALRGIVRKPLGTRAPDDESISVLRLSERAANVLTNQNITTIGQLCSRSWWQLRVLRNCGKHTIAEIERELEYFGRTLRDDGCNRGSH